MTNTDLPSLRVALWSPPGAGTHYNGPGSFAYRLYRSAPPGRYHLDLIHGFQGQAKYEIFEQQHFLGSASNGLLAQFRFLEAAKRWLVANAARFDVCHALAGFHATVQPAFWAEQLGLPAVLFIANHGVELTDKRGWRSILRLPKKRREMVRRLSAVVAMSEAIHKELIQHGVSESRIARIPMGVDTARFRPATHAERVELRRELGWPERQTLIFSGGITARKRPHLLVEAIAAATRANIDCQLVLAGPEHDAAYARAMRERISDLRLQDRVIWHGFTENIAPIYKAANVFGLLSEYEGMPAALVEAMATGLPSLVTPISGTSDLVSDGVHGRVIEPAPAAAGEALIEYLRNPTSCEAHGMAAREKAVSGYSVLAVLAAYDALYRRIMSGRPAAG